MPERALFLIDGPNFYKNMRNTGLRRKHLDYQKLAQLLAQGRTIVDVILFTSPVGQSSDPANYANQLKFFAAVKNSGVKLKLGKLEPRTRKCEFCGNEISIQVEKSVDVQLAMEIILRSNEYETLYLATCDSDLAPAVRHVRALGKTVFQVRPNRSRGAGLGAECNKTLIITQTHIDAAQAF
jgi:uncharacterized LabA/DUF88 family protein